VSGRTRDIGIRIALGAQRKTILQMVLSQGLALALAGAAVGLVGALIVSHLMAGLLYGVSPSDPLTFISLTVVLVIVAFAACYIPARRAMRVDPIVALREMNFCPKPLAGLSASVSGNCFIRTPAHRRHLSD
jgi:ABC-type antimicrobial peptide transport system permease subunit